MPHPGVDAHVANMNLPNLPSPFHVLHGQLARVVTEVRAFATFMNFIGFAARILNPNARVLKVPFYFLV